MDEYVYNVTPLRDAQIRASLQRGVRDLLMEQQLTLRKVPDKLYRGCKLYSGDHTPKMYACFTSSISEAEVYAKHAPNIIYIYRSYGLLRVLDLSCDDTKRRLADIFETNGVPRQLIKDISSPSSGSRDGQELDLFQVLHNVLAENNIHGFCRVTSSVTLGRSAEEFDIFREIIPEHIM